MSADVILESALNLARHLGETGEPSVEIEREGITWRYIDGEGLLIARGDETIDLPETALDELRWEVVPNG